MMNNKRTGLILVLAVLMAAGELYGEGTDGVQGVPGFRESSVEPGVSLKGYTAVYIDDIDMSEVELPSGDLDIDSGPDQDTDTWAQKRDIANEMRTRLEKELGKFTAVIAKKEDLGDQQTLVLQIKLEGALTENRLLMNVMEGEEQREAALSMRCNVYDAATGDRLFYVEDRQSSVSAGDKSSLMGDDDLGSWYAFMDEWSGLLAGFLEMGTRGVPMEEVKI